MSVYNRSRRSLQEACRDTRRWNARALHGMNRLVNARSNTRSAWRAGALAVVVLAALAAVAGGGCGHDIGDECKSSVDCDPNGTRSCDLSQPGGYCTVQGCDETACPSGSTCVRVFPKSELLPQIHCDPACEDLDCPTGRTNVCTADEVCLNSNICAKQSYEQRYCAKTCDPNGNQCRGGYVCRYSADPSQNTTPLASDPTATTYFCAPQPPTQPTAP
jgi:hypothetical protein